MNLSHSQSQLLYQAYRKHAMKLYAEHETINVVHTSPVQMVENGAFVEAVIWIPAGDMLPITWTSEEPTMKKCPNCETEMAKVEAMTASVDGDQGSVSIGETDPIFRCPDCKHKEPFHENRTNADARAEEKPDGEGTPPITD